LAEAAIQLGARADSVVVVRNGVDADLFRPAPQAAARQQLGLPADVPLVLYVGNLKASKGVVDLANAFAQLADADPRPHLVMVGGGDARAEVVAALARHQARVHLPGPVALEHVPTWMAAANLVALASWAEGTPNVLLEALACGRRVVATRVGGIPDVISDPAMGELVPARDVAALARALRLVLDQPYEPHAVADLATSGSWDASATALRAVLAAAISDPA
jgi:glycosyltransferase involved in cell wall biosynthesis